MYYTLYRESIENRWLIISDKFEISDKDYILLDKPYRPGI